MPGEEAHRGAEAPGFGAPQGDARVDYITELLLEADPIGQAIHRPVRDHSRALLFQQQRASRDNPLSIGMVVHAVPHLNWYRVQTSSGWIGCQMLSDHNCVPMGPRRGDVIAPGSRVIVWKHPNIDYGVILGVMPHATESPTVSVPGWLSQGSAVGLKREGAHRQPFKGMYGDGGIQDFSCQAPVDVTSMDLVYVTETGLCLLLSPFEIMLRVNEMCGLFLNYFDSQAALVGWNLSFLSACHEVMSGHDEGENRHREMTALYPWESAGAYSQQDLASVNDDVQTQYHSQKGAVDLPDGAEDTQPVYRTQHFKGYEGQGSLRGVIRPAGTSGRRKFSDEAADKGLFSESVGVDGSVLVHTAKSFMITKRVNTSWPKEIHPPESVKGDDASKDDYKFSSTFGGGPDHKIGDVKVEGDSKSLLKVAGVQDLIAHAINWKRLHPFHYRKDFHVPQESAGDFGQVNEPLDFDHVSIDGHLNEPVPSLLYIDHRYGQVEYYLRESMFAMLDDGSVVLGGGGSERIAFINGKIKIDCPGDIEITPGRDLIVQGTGVILKAQESIDVSSSRKDVRVWAHNNLQIGSAGSLLIDGQGSARDHRYKDKIGEDVEAGGVVIRSKGDLGLLGENVYVRSLSGDVVLDANKMGGDVVLLCSSVNVLQSGDFTIWHFSGPDGEVKQSHRFSRGLSHHQGGLVVGGSAYVGAVRPGTLSIIGGVRATRSLSCGGRVADGRGGTLGKVNETFVSDLEQMMQPIKEGITEIDKDGDKYKLNVFDKDWYVQYHVGNDEVLDDLGFSYRDSDAAGRQYGTSKLKFLESRWQTFARLGGGSAGQSWEENPVNYQGRELYPWPGREKWTGGGAFLRVSELTMYDAGAGHDRDRPGPYEDAKLGVDQTATMQEGVKIITHE